VSSQTSHEIAVSIPSEFLRQTSIDTDLVRPGDTLSISIYENVDAGLLSNGVAPAEITEVVVDNPGLVYLPYVGRILVSGKTTEQVRLLIERKLNEQTPDPQIIVRRVAGSGSTVNLIGSVAKQGAFPLDSSTRRLSDLIASAGGLSADAESSQISVIRNGKTAKIWASDLFSGVSPDIALRPKDRVLVSENSRHFVAFGAVGSQMVVPFGKDIALMEAVGLIGGLNPSLADPAGIFVFRKETRETAARLGIQVHGAMEQNIVYALDLSDPDSVFSAIDFLIRGNDVVFVSEAPFSRVSKVLQAVTGTAGSVGSIRSLAE
jgi:polysaccharide export outer membrane protein